MVRIPEAFMVAVIRGRGNAGRAWLERIPALLDDACRRWDLEIAGVPRHGSQGLVWPVDRDGEAAALKITWPDDMTRLEAGALAAWRGHGAVRMLAHDAGQGLLLLERLDPERTLENRPIDEAVTIAAGLLAKLAISPPATVPSLTVEARRMTDDLPAAWHALGRPFVRRMLEAAVDLAHDLGPTSKSLLVHRDLHYGNVLAGIREPWLAIDPMPIAADPEFGVARLLWRRFEEGGRSGVAHRLDLIIEAATLDRERAYGWTVVHCIDYWLWALKVGLTEDPRRCASIVAELLPTVPG